MKVDSKQIQILKDHIAQNPDHSPREVANYIARITDLDELNTLALGTIVMHLKNGTPIPDAYLAEDQEDGQAD